MGSVLFKNALRVGLVCVLSAFLFTNASYAASEITYWPDNKRGALSISFDDGCPSQYNLAVPALNEQGVRGTFFINTNSVTPAEWDTWSAVANMGHEIGSHTMSHSDLTTLSLTEIRNELEGSKAAIDARITSQECLTLAYPYGVFNGDVQTIAQDTYIAARGIWCDLNADPYDFYNMQSCSAEFGSYDIYARAYDAELQGKWLDVYLHSLSGGSDCYGDLFIDDLKDYLVYLKTRDLWVGTFGSVVKYIRERDSATLTDLSTSGNQIILSLTDAVDDSIYDEPLTIRSEVPSSWAYVLVDQGGSIATIESVWEGSDRVVYYDALPDGGLITLEQDSACLETGSLSITSGQTLSGDPLDLTSIVQENHATNVVYTVMDTISCPDQINSSIIARRDTWKYNGDNNGNIGDTWLNRDYDDSLWNTGNGIFGYGDPDINTPIGAPGQMSVYFRNTFTLCDANAVTSLRFYATYDDGMAVYLNGSLVAAEGVTGDPPAWNGGALNHESNQIYEEFNLDSAVGNLVTGTNVLAVGVYNISNTSSDLSFDGELIYSSSGTALFSGNHAQAGHADTAGWSEGEKELEVIGDDLTCGSSLMPASGTFLFQTGQSGETNCFDGIDNDGDGLMDCADNDCAGVTNGACATGQPGICSTGTLTCQGGAEVCAADNQPGAEVCDNEDNDCDGIVDENLIRPTTCGTGECSGNTGTETCSAGLWGNDTCDPLAGAVPEGPAGDQTCGDSFDNDCDGLTDISDPDCVGTCQETGSLSIISGQTLFGNPIDLTSIVTAINTTNLVYSVTGGVSCTEQASEVIIPKEETWKYDLQNSGTTWIDTNYDDSGWSTGYGIFGTDADEVLRDYSITTPISNTNNSMFFRKSFTVCNPSEITALTLNALFDDGVAVYVNGTQVYSQGVAGDPPPYNGGADSHEAVVYESKDLAGVIGLNALRSLLVPGSNNVLAIGVYNAIPNSSDIVWDGELFISQNATGNVFFTGNETMAQKVDTTGWTNGEKALEVTGDDATCLTALPPALGTFIFEASQGVETNCFDGIDNDNDGVMDCADTDCAGATDGACTTGQPGICSTGILTCQGSAEVCVADSQPQAEVCDNVDNDCDGTVDENLTRSTTCGVGECAGNTGAESCDAGVWGNDTCDPHAGSTTEVCGDGIDQDCNGSDLSCGDLDEDGDGFTPGQGDCDDTNAQVYPGAADAVCDGVDNNCDGVADDGYMATATSCGTGECANTGETTCTDGVEGDTCQAGVPQAEVCDNLDNDCDGTIDETLTRATTCGVGECSGNTGIETCTAGTWGNDSCDPYAGAIPEGPYGDATCSDTLDNDCDGSSDTGDADCAGVIPFTYTEDFESGALGAEWTTSSTYEGRIGVTTGNNPCGGSYHLTLDDSVRGGSYSLNEAILTLDLAGQTGVELSFSHKEYADENHIMPDVFSGSSNSDGVAISADGQIWHRVQGLTSTDGISSSCTQFIVDMDAAAAAAGIGYNRTFKIKFQQYDNYPISSDGFAFDDIVMTGQSSGGGDCIDGDIRSCGTSDVGECQFGTETCSNGTWGACLGSVEPAAETCDNLDNDCDGTTDENLTRPTTCGVGECAGNAGTESCDAGIWGNDTCDPYAGAVTEGPPGDQTCGDTLDNDCDGETDKNDADCIDVCQGSISIVSGQTLIGNPIDLTSIVKINDGANLIYTVTGSSSGTCDVDPSGTYIEAENFTGTITQGSAAFSVETSQNGYSGSGYLLSNGGGTGSCPPVHEGREYKVNFQTPGKYTVWMRGYAIGGSDNSVFVGLDGNCVGALSETAYNAWTWTNSLQNGSNTITVDAIGDHTINIWVREPGHKIDGIYLDMTGNTPTDGSHGVEIDPNNCGSGGTTLFTGNHSEAQTVNTTGWTGGGKNLTVDGDDATCGTPMTASGTFTFENQTVVETNCNDGIDNDNDGQADCADPDCDGSTNGSCSTGQPGICSTGTLTCQNGADECVADNQPEPEICNDKLDNDCDGVSDGDDTVDCPPVRCSDYSTKYECKADSNCRWNKWRRVCIDR